jgi:hypothetical protein
MDNSLLQQHALESLHALDAFEQTIVVSLSLELIISSIYTYGQAFHTGRISSLQHEAGARLQESSIDTGEADDRHPKKYP